MLPEAIMLCSGEASMVDLHLARLTEALGVQCRMLHFNQVDNLETFLTGFCRESPACIMVSARSLAALLQDTTLSQDVITHIFECTKFILVYGITPDEREMSAVRYLTDGLISSVVSFDRPDYAYQVSATAQDITYEFSRLTFGPINPTIDFGLVLHQPYTECLSIVSINNLPTFASLKKRNARVFLLACREIVDLDAQTDGSWLTHVYFSRIVPVMMFLRHVFRDYLWHNPRRYANLMIDDPLLQETYGFLNYKQLLQEMDGCEFAATIAFIPWNYKRTNDSVARMFREHADRFSICIHGCDHTEGEFASTDLQRLNRQLHLATQRMNAHEQSTSLPYDEVMIFPQGKFSSASLGLLKCHNYLAAVNSSPVPTDLGEAHGLTIADFLTPAISKYGDFPLFVRRSPREVVDCAFDLFLEKPALLVAHHDFFKNGYDHIRECVNQLNALSTKLQWTNLGELIRNTYFQRTISKDKVECKIFTNRQLIFNSDYHRKAIYNMEARKRCSSY